MAQQPNEQTGPKPAIASSAGHAGGYHWNALILLWIVIIIAAYLIWPSNSFIFGNSGDAAPSPSIRRASP
ncbi:MAG: hypothetical protein WCK65_01345 [Rhodospirillaceae bacterium]